MSKVNNPTGTTPAKPSAIAKYQSNSVRWTASAKIGSQKEYLLSLAKQDKAFVADFWVGGVGSARDTNKNAPNEWMGALNHDITRKCMAN